MNFSYSVQFTDRISPFTISPWFPVLVQVVNQYFRKSSRFIVHENEFSHQTNLSFHLFPKLLAKSQNRPIFQISVTQATWPLWATGGRHFDAVIMIKNPSESVILHSPSFCSTSGRLLILLKGAKIDIVKQTFMTIWVKSRVYNVVVASLFPDEIHFYSWNPYHPKSCYNLDKVKLVDSWHKARGFSKNATIFEDNEISLKGCYITVGTIAQETMVSEDFKDGFEMNIAIALSKYFGFTMNLFTNFNKFDFWGYSPASAVSLLYNQLLDLAFCGITAQHGRYAITNPLYPHNFEYLVWNAPVPSLVSTVYSVFYAFSLTAWLWFLFIIFIFTLAAFISPEFYSKPELFSALFYVLSMLLNGIPSYKPRKWFLRTVTALVVMFSTHFVTAYQSSLISILTTSFSLKPFKDFKDMIEAGLNCYVFTNGKFLLESEGGEILKELCSFDVEDHDIVLEKIAYNRSAFFLFPKNPSDEESRNYVNEEKKSLIYILPEPYMAMPSSFFMTPGHPLVEIFDKKVQSLIDFGIVGHWWEISTHKFKSRDSNNNNNKPLQVTHLTGAFAIFGITIFLSVIAFAGELIYSFTKNKYSDRDSGKIAKFKMKARPNRYYRY